MKSNRLLSRWACLAALTLVLGFALPSRAAQGGQLNLHVVANLGLLDIIASPMGGQGPFYIPGTIFAPGTSTVIGTFHCWGFFIQGGAVAVVSQEYELFGRGKIQVQGIEDEGPRAVTGGTGEFNNVRGEMTGADLGSFPMFDVTFKLLGAKS